MIKKLISYSSMLLLLVSGTVNQTASRASEKNLSENPLEDRFLEQIKQDGKLVVLTRNAPTTYYKNESGFEGFEYRLTQMLGKALHVNVDYVVYASNEEIVQALRDGKGHIAAAGLSRNYNHQEFVNFGPDYHSIKQQIVCNRHAKLPKSPLDLSKVSLYVAAGHGYDEKLRAMINKVPKIRWHSSQNLSTEELLQQVWAGKIDCTVADSNIFAVNRRYYPELKVAFNLPNTQELAWAIPKHAGSLAAYLENWFKTLEETDELARLNEESYGFTKYFDYPEHAAFSAQIDKKLPKYRRLFETATDKSEMPWTLVAAVAYQESHWQPDAVSEAGASGLMMLMHDAAEEVNVHNRLDPVQSVYGGTRYLEQITQSLPKQIKGEDRYWIALAGYNAGLGHLQDALKLTKQLGRNPNYWADVKVTLPLLAQEKYYRKLRHGYAKGTAVVHYVQKIRDYQDVLEKRVAQTRA